MRLQKVFFKEKWKPRRIDSWRDLVYVYRGPKTSGIPEILLVSTIFKIIQAELRKKDINSPSSFRQLDKLTNVSSYLESSRVSDRDLMPRVHYIK